MLDQNAGDDHTPNNTPHHMVVDYRSVDGMIQEAVKFDVEVVRYSYHTESYLTRKQLVALSKNP